MYQEKTNCIYYNKKKLKGIDINSFETLSEFIAKDKSKLFYKGNVVKEDIDIASFEVLNQYYAKDKAKVFYQTKTKLKHLKSAKSDRFIILEENFARSINSLFFQDKRIIVTNKENFQILAKNIATDGSYIYIESSKKELEEGFDLSTIQCIQNRQISDNEIVVLDKNIYFLRSNYSEITTIEDIDSGTFEFLNHYYSYDKHNFYYQENIFEKNNGQEIVFIDNYTIALDDKYYIKDKFVGNEKLVDIDDYFLDNNYVYDDLGNFLEKRETIDLKSITEKDTILAIKKSIELFFYIYDNNYTTLSSLKDLESYKGYDKTPKYEIRLEKNLINIHYDNKVFSGYISAFTSLFSKFWCYCRGYQVDNKSFVKFISYIGHNSLGYLTLIKNMYEHNYKNFIIIASYFYNHKYLEEVQFIIYEGFVYARPKNLIKTLTIMPLDILLSIKRPVQYLSFEYKSTYLATAKHAIFLIKDESSVHKRYLYVRIISEMLRGTGNLKAFDKPVLTPLMQIVQNEQNPAIKEFLYLALQMASTISSYMIDWALDKDTMYWYEQSYKLSKFLVEQGINLDTNYIKLWITQHVINQDDKAINNSFQALQQLIKIDCPAPAIYIYAYSKAFGNFKVLMIYYSIRLALIMTKDMAKNILKNGYKEIDALRFNYNYHSMQTSLVLIQTKMIEVAKRHKIHLPFDDYTNKDSCSGYSNMFRTIASTKFNLKEVKIMGSGLYKEQHILKKLDYKLVDKSKQLKIKLFDKIGIDYLLDGEPWNREIATHIKVTHPPLKNTKESITTFDSVSVIGMKNSFYWNFEDENELVAGKWSIEISFTEDGLKLEPLFVEFDIGV